MKLWCETYYVLSLCPLACSRFFNSPNDFVITCTAAKITGYRFLIAFTSGFFRSSNNLTADIINPWRSIHIDCTLSHKCFLNRMYSSAGVIPSMVVICARCARGAGTRQDINAFPSMNSMRRIPFGAAFLTANQTGILAEWGSRRVF